MSRAPAKYTQADVTRLYKGARAAGERVRVEYDLERRKLVAVPVNGDAADDDESELAKFRRNHGYG